MHSPKQHVDLLARASSKSSNVGWISPLEKDIYYPGATILAKWASSQMIESPAFRLCMVSTSQQDSSSEPAACGATVWPEITESAGVYQAPVTVPDALWDGSFFLEMKDSSGAEMRSPVFTLSPGGASGPVAGSGPQAQAPLGSPNSPAASVTLIASPLYPSSFIAISSAPTPSALNQVSSTATIDPNVLSAAKTTPPAAAYAVPLSAVAAIILVATGLFLKRRRRTGSPHAEKSSRTSSYKSSADHALHVLPRHLEYGSSPKDRKLRQPTQDAFPYPAYAQWAPPTYGYTEHRSDPPTYRADSPRPVQHPCRDERPRLPQTATTASFMSTSGPATHVVLANYLFPSPPLASSTSTPRCLLPAPQQLHLREDASRSYHTDNPLGSPPADRHSSERDLYARVASKLDMYRRS
ncbi:hypothetical protein B0H19DRAFT_1131492 [Mycena capillaripes]|nr:hypothetical protein B0H19DRAFT_1131492 [Mycena capillaripes]